MKPDVPALRRHLNLPAPGWMAVSRGAALGLSCLLTMNLMEVFAYGTSSVENWFVDLNPLTQPVGITLLTMASLSLLMFSLKAALPGPVQLITLGLTLTFSGFFGRELWTISSTVAEADQAAAMAQPLGALMLFAVASIGVLRGNSDAVRGRSSLPVVFISAILTVVGFVIVLIQSSALSDPLPEKPVPATLMLVCDPNSDGTPSDALTDRVLTAARLLQDGHSRTLIVSPLGASLSESFSEMLKKLVAEAGVSDPVMLSEEAAGDLNGLLVQLAQQQQFESDRRIIIVTHWYELARVRMLAKRAGFQVTAAATRQKHALFGQNGLVLREAGHLLSCLATPTIVYLRDLLKPANPDPNVRSR